MIEMLEGFSDNVVAGRAVGRVARPDYKSVLIPRVEAAARVHPMIRCYYEMQRRFHRHGTGRHVGVSGSGLSTGRAGSGLLS